MSDERAVDGSNDESGASTRVLGGAPEGLQKEAGAEGGPALQVSAAAQISEGPTETSTGHNAGESSSGSAGEKKSAFAFEVVVKQADCTAWEVSSWMPTVARRADTRRRIRSKPSAWPSWKS